MECAFLGAPWVGPAMMARVGAELGARPPDRLVRLYTAFRAVLRARLSLAHLLDPVPREPAKWEPQAARYLGLAELALVGEYGYPHVPLFDRPHFRRDRPVRRQARRRYPPKRIHDGLEGGQLTRHAGRYGCGGSNCATADLAHARLAIVAEELVAAGRVPNIGNAFILADPLDGTREFVVGRKECAINLALVEDGRPVAGAIYAPLTGQLWLSGRESLALAIAPEISLAKAMAGARRITVRSPPPSGLVALVSRSHLDPATQNYLGRLPIVERRALGSSLKFCLIAQGEADIYPRLGETCEWDTAAGHAILAAAGGVVSAPDGRPLRYGNRAGGFRHHGFVACGGFRITADGKLANA